MDRSDWLDWRCTVGLGRLALLAESASALGGQLAPDLAKEVKANPNSGKSVRVIVQFNRGGVDGVALASSLNGKALGKLGLINGATLTLPLSAIQALAKHSAVSFV